MNYNAKTLIIHEELESIFSSITSPEFQFLYGYEKEVNQILNNMNKSIAKRDQTELVCWLVQNYKKEYSGKSDDSFDFTTTLNLILICKSNAKDYTDARYEKIIKPKLIPLKDAIVLALRESGIVEHEFSFIETEYPYYDAANKDSNIFDSYVDVILLEPTLKFYKQYLNC